jgi:hypothetical protein
VGVSLVSAPVIGFDLARHPNGPDIAHVLLRGLSLGQHDLETFADIAGLSAASTRERDRELVKEAERAGRWGAVAPDSQDQRPEEMIASLQNSMILDLDDFDRLIRADILAWADQPAASRADSAGRGHAARVSTALHDRVAALWSPGVAQDVRHRLSACFELADSALAPGAPDVGPCGKDIVALLAVLRNADDDTRLRLRAVTKLRPTAGERWAQAVHDAAWAAFTTGRIRAAATAQLMGVGAFRAGGFDARDGADGVWNVVSAHIQGLVLGDVLGWETRTELAANWSLAGID